VLLAVDIGNTQTSFGVFDEGRLIGHWRAETKPSRTADEYGALLFPLMQHAGLGGVAWSGIALCSVVPPAEYSFELFCKNYLRQLPFRVNVDLDLGFTLNVQYPREVGADRLANAAYASAHLELPAIVVDFGTATTFDVISKEKVYEGGVILPGVRIALEALAGRTSKLTRVDLEFPQSVIGKNTTECIQSGILYGYCDLIDGLLSRASTEVTGRATIVLTGGLASLFQNRLKTASIYLPNLTLEGIELLYRRNLSETRS